MAKPIDIDGARGEGGGQILRTSLALSLLTGRPFRISNIRARRPKPGLRKQHLAAVKAAVAVGAARVNGDFLGSLKLEFYPSGRYGGNYAFDVGSAGSCGLVLQTVLPALMTADRPSYLSLRGGTHNPWAPPYDFLAQVFLPLLNRMGPTLRLGLQRYGFYPGGGGAMAITITPAATLVPFEIKPRGDFTTGRVRAIIAGLPRHIAERECRAFAAVVQLNIDHTVEELPSSCGPGNVVMAEIGFSNIGELFSAFGQRGKPAERVAAELAAQVNDYLSAGAPVGPYLADQLLIPLAMAGKGAYLTGPPTRHTQTNLIVVRQFLEVAISMRQVGASVWEIFMGP